MPPTTPMHGRLVVTLCAAVIGMFLFAVFIMPPFYDVICALTGLNGKTDRQSASNEGITTETGRELRIQFLAKSGQGMPWRFEPRERSMQVYPGEIRMTSFTVENLTSTLMTSNAVPSISPAQAARYFKKTQCFCFEKQTLPGGEKKDMPVIFYVDPSLPREISTITLSYTLYPSIDQTRTVSNQIL